MCCLFGIVLHEPNPGHRQWSVKRRWTSTNASCIKVRSRSVPQPPRLSLIPKKIQITNCKWFSIVQTQATKIQAYLQLNYLLTNTSNFQAAFGVVGITLATWSYKAWQGTYFYCIRNGRKGTLWSKPGEGRVYALSLVCKTRSSIFLKVQQALRVLLARSGRGARDTRDGCSHRACLALRASLALTSPVWKTRNSWLEVMFIAEQKDLERFEEGTRTTFVLWGVDSCRGWSTELFLLLL